MSDTTKTPISQSSSLNPAERRVWAALEACACEPKQETDHFRFNCPAHHGDDKNCTFYFNNGKGLFKCWSRGCSHAEIRNALELKAADLKSVVYEDYPLQRYADEKHLDVTRLKDKWRASEFSVETEKGSGHFVTKVLFPVRNKNRKVVSEQIREFKDGKAKTRNKSGTNARVCGIEFISLIKECDYIVLCEGASDVQTFDEYGIIAFGVPGVDSPSSELVASDLGEIVTAAVAAGKKIYLFQEPGEPAIRFISSFRDKEYCDQLQLVTLENHGHKDPSELHIANSGGFLEIWNKAIEAANPWHDPLGGSKAKTAKELSVSINKLLNTNSKRETLNRVAEMISGYFQYRDRLIKTDDGRLYVIGEDNSMATLDVSTKNLKHILFKFGVYSYEKISSPILQHLQDAAKETGRNCRVAHYAHIGESEIYVSCGETKMAVITRGSNKIRLEPNGYNGIFFPADSTFPEWQVSRIGMPITGLPAFRCLLYPPSEVTAYTPEMQAHFQTVYAMCVLLGVVTPALTSFGPRGSGKSNYHAALAKLFHGKDAGVVPMPNKESDFLANITNSAYTVFDNIDGIPPDWFHDAFSMAVTRGVVSKRELFTTNTLSQKQITSAIAITTRTADFAQDKDTQDRVLPNFYSIREDETRLDAEEMLNNVTRYRSHLLTSLMRRAASAWFGAKITKGLPTRFQAFGRLTVGFLGVDAGKAALETLQAAQMMSIGRPDNVTNAIVEYMGNHDNLTGSATAVFKTLKASTDFVLPSVSGRNLANKLRESKRNLQLAGIDLAESTRHDAAYFQFEKSGLLPETAQTV